MREVKFRAWDNINKNMRYDIATIDFELNRISFKNPTNRTVSENYREFWYLPYELMQYTGLEDVNGREIYEGDIVAYLDSYDTSTENSYNFEDFINKGEIVFNETYGRFDVTDRSDIDYFDFIECVGECEIIGNVYENPELLSE